ncbi:chromate reductase [Providencia burhodogranariea DSM 19968]|uniref:Chromate reductase n=1 Tax=Providencia burhodogranariea DSM 19968 TaxID=1141662 RepID=K8WTI1_9GAMM|nr:chromate reductase [Providencia burhodogranariea DSM 19968]
MGNNAWDGLPVGILGASIHNIGTAVAQQHLRNILVYLNMPTLNQPEYFFTWLDGMVDEQYNFPPQIKEFIQVWANAYAEFIEKISAK